MARIRQIFLRVVVVIFGPLAAFSCFDLDKVEVRDVRLESQTGTHVEWTAHFKGRRETYARSMDVFENGNVAICGQFEKDLKIVAHGSSEEVMLTSTNESSSATFVTSFLPGLTLDWKDSLDGLLLGACDIAALDDKSTILSGEYNDLYYTNSAGTRIRVEGDRTSAYLMLYDTFGKHNWGLKVIGPEIIEQPRVTALPGYGNGLIVSGMFADEAFVKSINAKEKDPPLQTLVHDSSLCADDFSGFYVMRVNRDGHVPWWFAPEGCAVANAVESLSGELIVVAGAYDKNVAFSDSLIFDKTGTRKTDGFIALYRSGELDASPVWVRDLSGTRDDAVLAVASTSSGDIIVGGIFEDNIAVSLAEDDEIRLDIGNDGEDYLFFANYSSDGELRWVRYAGGTGEETLSAIAAFSDGSFLVGGSFTDHMTFDPGKTNETTLKSKGKSDGFLAYFDAAGELVFARREGGAAGDDGITDISLVGKRTALILGFFTGDVTLAIRNLGERQLVSAEGNDSFLMKLNIDEAEIEP